MIWVVLFAVSIVQGLFLLSLIAMKGSKNPLASRLVIAILIVMIFINLGYLVIRTDLVNYVPHLFGVPFGMTLLFGPLLYFYSKSVVDPSFRWKKKYWLHFIPYGIQLSINMPFMVLGKSAWIDFINTFLAGDLPILPIAKVGFAVQDLHLFIYLVITVRWIRAAKTTFSNPGYLIAISSRIKWVTALVYCLFLLLITIFSLYIFILVQGKFNPVTNYIYSLIVTGIIYFIAYKWVLHPDLVSPDFKQKYQAYRSFIGEEGEKYLQTIRSLMDESKIFTDPDLSLSELAKKIGLPSHQVSKLINEKFGKSFTDFVNEYRVREFINRMNQVQNKSYTLYGIALDVGFNSKSSFNTAFKKCTGKTPSNYKRLI